ncbi:hypothetical protein COCMIDRAFT_31172 [Bipolaris oryzae ATCC 44560]|uniref:Azaphilone pigments biosynthesis cluster protein L N-terminal domain-containing protein n=1 Tax=Bipolaris oryzae ATCC 44560 TaxID=930090 RepID=W6YW45_COCMI|nr:uncharacterized protein COCMIDRAFT_31172 [Bipolaris oryzae ATCC 44560]EUC39744.1 hypothetical protein COCMIDRAFT_31172 [Bipolaris oryzae ATCC 44560]
MDPLSITASAIGITAFATSSIVQLRNIIDGLSEAQDVVADVASSLANIERPLAALERLSISDESTSVAAKEDLRKAGVAEAVNECGNICNKFSKNLSKWTKHSSSTKLSLRDRLSVGVWNREKIRTLNTQLQSMVQLRSEKTSETDRENVKRQLQTLETKIQEHLDLTKRQQDQALERKRALEEEPEDEEDGGAQRMLAIKEVEQQSRLLEADQVSCGVVFSQVRSKRSGQEISNIITLDNSKALVGLLESVIGKIN